MLELIAPADATARPPMRRCPAADAAMPPRLPSASIAGRPPKRKRTWWQAELTAAPLLDMPRLPHPWIVSRFSGRGSDIPTELIALLVWASERLDDLGAGPMTAWRYEHAAQPEEMLVHAFGRGGHCHHVGRPHASENIMVTIDMLNQLAWQRCWDPRYAPRRDPGAISARSRRDLGAISNAHASSCGALHAAGALSDAMRDARAAT